MPDPVPGRGSGENVDMPPAQMPAGVAGKRVQGEQHHVDPEDERPDPDAEPVGEPERQYGIPGQDDDEEHGEIKGVAMDVLKDEGKGGFAVIAPARIGEGARSRGPPE